MNRFWKRRNYAFHHENPNMPIVTRDFGDIPGCKPALDVFVEMTHEEVVTAINSDGYQKVWDDYRNGVIGFREWVNHPIHKRTQRSFIKNPSLPIHKLMARLNK